MAEEYVTPSTRSTPVLRFIIIAVVLIVALLTGLYFGKQYLDSQKNSLVTTSSSDKKEKQAETSDKQKEQKAQEKAKKKQQQEAKQAEAEKKAEEEKKKAKAEAEANRAQTPAALPGDTTSSSQQRVATTGPSEVASTGPTETFIFLVSIASLAYGVYSFVRSRRELKEVTKKRLLT